MSSRTRGAAVSALLAPALVAALAACGGPVALDRPDLPPAEAARCADLVADLPPTLADQASVETTPDEAPGAAWGDPPLVLQCGAPVPDDFTETSECLQVSGVGWFAPPAQESDPEADVQLTTVGHRPAVRLTVPADQRGEVSAAALAELAAPVEEHLEQVQPCL